MRLWSVHPSQLDRIALVAVWREGLLAMKVLEGKTKGYRNHPQLDRFKSTDNPLTAINQYLYAVADEAAARGYAFDYAKLGLRQDAGSILLHDGQLAYEWQHLLRKCLQRSKAHHGVIITQAPLAHPSFRVVPGDVEPWERITGAS